MPDYGRFCPVSLSCEVLGDRWTPLIVRELLFGNTRFNDIARGLPGISRSLLVQRLRHLERNGVVELWPSPTGRGHEYHLTPAGRDLKSVVEALGRWAVQWRFDEIRPDQIDAATLMWWMHRHIAEDELPPQRVVVEFRHTAPARTVLWVVLDRGEASVCVQPPGFDTDVLVTATTQALAEVFSGFDTWTGALASGSVRLDGPTPLVRAFPRWFPAHSFAEQTRERLGERRAAVAAAR